VAKRAQPGTYYTVNITGLVIWRYSAGYPNASKTARRWNTPDSALSGLTANLTLATGFDRVQGPFVLTASVAWEDNSSSSRLPRISFP